MSLDRLEAAALVHGAAQEDQSAWDSLVAEFGNLIWAITRSYGLTPHEAADVSQTTWLRLCENIERLRDPGAVGAWLATTARRECLRSRNLNRDLLLVEDVSDADDGSRVTEAVDSRLLRHEAVATVRKALGQLPGQSQAMLSMLMRDEPASYAEVAACLRVPIGSVGPTRGRALHRLRKILEVDLGSAASAME